MLPARIHRRIYLVLLTLLGGTMVCSTWAANLMWVLLGANWVLEGRWGEKWAAMKRSKALHAYIAIYVVLLAGMLWTSNQAEGWRIMQVSLPLIVVPLVMLTTRPVEGQARRAIMWLYSGTVVVVSVIASVRMWTIEGLPYRDAVPYISHIRFALNCCMVIFFMATEELLGGSGKVGKRIGSMAVVAWLLVFLLMIRSYTAVVVIVIVSMALIVVYYRRWWTIGLWVAAVVAMAVAVGSEVRNYYRLIPQSTEPLVATTAGGRPYTHANDGMIENGNYTNNYLCSEELRQEWNKRSSIDYDNGTTGEGYGVESTLVRYMAALGLTRDSVGLAMMDDNGIAAVERGVANPVYEEGNMVKKMVYVMLFEYESYKHYGAVKGFTMLQRIELWHATTAVIAESPWIGVGTGDATQEMHSKLEEMESELMGTTKKSHNEYLTLLSMVGVLGFAIVALASLRALATATKRRRVGALMLAWILTALISFATEDTLDTLAGILFCTYFLAFRPNTKAKKNSQREDN